MREVGMDAKVTKGKTDMNNDGTTIDITEYKSDLTTLYDHIPEVVSLLLADAGQSFDKIEELLYQAPSFLNMIKSGVPEMTLQAVLTDDQKQQLAKGALKLMTKKDGTLLAQLIDPKTNKLVKQVPLESVQLTPELSQAMTNYATQMQMIQIAEQIQAVQHAVEEVLQGQEHDRLATAYSCQQKLLQAMKISNLELRNAALLRLAFDAEDSRNLLMLSQQSNVKYIASQPENIVGKFLHGESQDKIDDRMNEIWESLSAINMVSLAEAVAYQEMGEVAAAQKSLEYYADFVQDTYLAKPVLLQRLDMMDSSTECCWTKRLPAIKNQIEALPYARQETLTMEESTNA